MQRTLAGRSIFPQAMENSETLANGQFHMLVNTRAKISREKETHLDAKLA